MKFLLTFIFSIFLFPLFSQTNEQQKEALKIAKEAIALMDEGKIDQSIELLSKAENLDSTRIDYPYEIAYAYYLKKDYDQAIATAQRVLDHPNVIDRVYQLLGSIYDIKGDSEKAIESYELGMKKFPESGKLYLEAGVVENSRENYNKAIEYWETGIKVEPNYSSNYYWLAKIFSRTDELIWSLLYGEIFIDLELGSSRTEEISKLLYEVYRQTYTVESDTSGQFNLTKRGVEIVIKNKKDLKELKKKGLPFEGTFGSVYVISALGFHDGIDMSAIVKARKNFLNNWFDKHSKNYPNALLDYQKRMIEAGVFEAYSYYFISRGNFEEFSIWQENNEQKFNEFSDWIQKNPIELKTDDLYARTDY